ncbi:hypothetical protein [Sedimenticola sp.]|uniref:hypothetical protein n=1 Tax=Sedimenticola sp. TaxID=1940285 RepID=UPI00258E03CC|nr:hypothetical protein [Sedimenticola sp.]MCW8905272.1 alginate export family protein [Sedimenticola sp.]
MRINKRRCIVRGVVAAALSATWGSASALNLMKNDTSEINLDIEAIFGVFHSDESYAQLLGTPGSVSWQEGYVKYGFSGSTKAGSGSLFGAINLLTSGTFGDGDAAGFTTGDETETDFEDLYVGWRNEMFEVSAGSQNITIGDGFLINGDALNFGKGFEAIPGAPDMDRGGAYWLAARKAFKKSLMLKLGGESGLRGDLFWLESDNPAQASMELAGLNVEHVSDHGTVGAYFLKGLDVDATEAAFMGLTHRDGQRTAGVRFQGSMGIENLFLSAEYANQDQGDNTRLDADAWYMEAGWTFSNIAWSPSLNYRYSQFDTGFDPLFFGFNRGYGTWFQGEVAANYAGPFNSDTGVHHIALKATPMETLTVGALFFDFNGDSNSNLDATELDLFAEWVVNDHLILSPLIGFYNPKNSAAQGGTQLGSSGTSTYFQLLTIVPF